MKKQILVSNMTKTNLTKLKDKKLKRKRKFRLLHKKKELKNLCKNRGVVYINHIPHGFYEEELFNYFTQFGRVTAVKVPRSNKTGNSKGCAFVEFADKDVAQVAADAMNNYLMFNCLLQTKYMPPEEQKPIAFDRNGKPWINRRPTQAADLRRKKDKQLKEKAVTNIKKFAEKAKNRVAVIHKKLKSKTGIDYEFQINDDAELLKVTNKPDDEEPTTSNDADKTDNDIKIKKLKKSSKSDLAQAAVKKVLEKGRERVLRSNTKEVLKNTTKKVLKNTTNKVLKTTTNKVLKTTKKKVLRNKVKKATAV